MMNFELVFIDDDENILEILDENINIEGFENVLFSNPTEALSYIAENHKKVCMITCDYQMPEMDGFELREKINDKSWGLPFILVTGFLSEEIALKGVEHKICAFMDKPIDYEKLTNTIIKESANRKAILTDEIEMVVSFVDESYPMIDEIEELILELEEDPHNMNAINTYFRLLHTIKGTAACVGLNDIAEFTHKYEDLVGEVKDKIVGVSSSLITVLLKGLDVLKRLYEQVKTQGCTYLDLEEEVKIFDVSRLEKVDIANQEDTSVEKVQTTQKKEDKLSVSIANLDKFMGLSGELTVARNSILKISQSLERKYIQDPEVILLQDSLSEMHKISSLLQSELTEMRKVSLESIYRPIKRVVRDTSSQLGKNIELKLKGEDLKVDTSLAKALNGTLVHLIRNSIDHGIESKEVRKQRNKPEVGTVELSTYYKEENVVVEISDDGNGLNKEVLIKKALEKELFTEEQLNAMSDQKIFSLIFHSGFSTAQAVTDISGRGVGMDMVRSTIEAIGGKIIIDSTYGVGSKFILVMPIPKSVTIIESLFVKVGSERFAVPVNNIVEVILMNSSNQPKIYEVNDTLSVDLHGDLVPLVDMNKTLGSSSVSAESMIVVVREEAFKFGLIVDGIFDIEEIVVKSFSPFLSDSNVFKGSCLAGNDGVALLFDIGKIAEHSGLEENYEDDLNDSFLKDSHTIINTESRDDFIQVNLLKKGNYSISLDFVYRLEEIEISKFEYVGDSVLLRYRDETLKILILDNECFGTKYKIQDYDNSNERVQLVIVKIKGNTLGLVVDSIGDLVGGNEPIQPDNQHKAFIGKVYYNERLYTILNIFKLFDEYSEEKNIDTPKEVSIKAVV